MLRLLWMEQLLSMENGSKKLTVKKHIGLSKMVFWKTILGNIYTLMPKNGKIKQVGGVLQSKEIYKLILKRSILSHQNFPI